MKKPVFTVKILTVLCAALSALFMGLIVFVWDGTDIIASTAETVKPLIGQGMNLSVFPLILAILASLGAVSLIFIKSTGKSNQDYDNSDKNFF
jgi:hypothetical protein